MELKKFIKKTLTDIIEGVSEAQNEIENGTIVPKLNETVSVVETGISRFQKIEFEVSVNVIEKEGSEAKLSVVAAIVGGNIKGDSSNTSGHSAKLNFGIPVKFKTMDDDE